MGLFSRHIKVNSTSELGREKNREMLEASGGTPRSIEIREDISIKRHKDYVEVLTLIEAGHGGRNKDRLERQHKGAVADADARLHNAVEALLRKRGIQPEP